MNENNLHVLGVLADIFIFLNVKRGELVRKRSESLA